MVEVEDERQILYGLFSAAKRDSEPVHNAHEPWLVRETGRRPHQKPRVDSLKITVAAQRGEVPLQDTGERRPNPRREDIIRSDVTTSSQRGGQPRGRGKGMEYALSKDSEEGSVETGHATQPHTV